MILQEHASALYLLMDYVAKEIGFLTELSTPSHTATIGQILTHFTILRGLFAAISERDFGQ